MHVEAVFGHLLCVWLPAVSAQQGPAQFDECLTARLLPLVTGCMIVDVADVAQHLPCLVAASCIGTEQGPLLLHECKKSGQWAGHKARHCLAHQV
jgi:hypothetical protein